MVGYFVPIEGSGGKSRVFLGAVEYSSFRDQINLVLNNAKTSSNRNIDFNFVSYYESKILKKYVKNIIYGLESQKVIKLNKEINFF